MKASKLLCSLIAIAAQAPMGVWAAGWHTAKVDQIAILGSGYVQIHLTAPIPAGVNNDCKDNSWVITEGDLNAPAPKGVLSVAQLAMTQGNNVSVYVDGCNGYGLGNTLKWFVIK